MKFKKFAFFGLAILLAGAAITTTYYQYNTVIVKAKVVIDELPSSAVKIEVEGGLGSGVVIDGNAVLTAAHVVGDNKEVTIKNENGDEVQGTVLWKNEEYDIALVQVKIKAQVAELDCSVQPVGTPIEFKGNPLGIEFITTKGYIAGKIRNGQGKWKAIYPVDATVIMGMSGGGVFNSSGKLVGITVGVANAMAQALDINGEKLPIATQNIVGIGFVVPSSSVCELLGKK